MQQIRVITSFKIDKEVSNAILKALTPDNIDFPQGLSMEIVENDGLSIVFTCSDISKMSSMINMVDEVLEHVSIVLDMIGDKDVRS